MPDQPPPRTPDPLANLTPEEIARLKTLADKHDQALDTVTGAIDKANDARRNIIDRMR